jgi:hypothetical protein
MTITLSVIEKLRRSNKRFTVIFWFLAAEKCLLESLSFLIFSFLAVAVVAD